MKISCVQMDMALGKPDENFDRAGRLIAEAAAGDPDVIVLPETWNTGFFPREGLPGLADADCARTDRELGSLAAKFRVNLVAGSVASLRGGKVFNTCRIYDRRGALAGSYDKTHLFTPMWVFPLEQTKPEILCPFSTFVHPVYGYTARHNGVDPAADEGDAILAVSDGAVTEAAFSEIYGNYILIEHQNGYVSQYQHCSALYVQKGDSVLRGQQIAAVGQTGWVTDSHLHLSILKDGEAIDPMVLLG